MQLIEIFEGNLFQAQMVKNLLENENIKSFLKDEIIGTRSAVWSPRGGVKVMVPSIELEKAQKIVEEFERTQSNTN